MKHHRTVAFTAILAILAATSAQAMPGKGGTDILHLTISANLAGDGEAEGTVVADTKIQGRAEKQSLKLQLQGLVPSTTYSVLITTLTETNLVEIDELITDTNGVATSTYRYKKQGGGPFGNPLPLALSPVSQLRTVEISLGGTQTVLAADLTVPEKIQYLVKRALTNDGTEPAAVGALRIKSNGVVDQLRIRARGLAASSSYHLVLNDWISAPIATDDKGVLSIVGFPADAPDLLDITSLAIVDGSTNSVLSTTLP